MLRTNLSSYRDARILEDVSEKLRKRYYFPFVSPGERLRGRAPFAHSKASLHLGLPGRRHRLSRLPYLRLCLRRNAAATQVLPGDKNDLATGELCYSS